MAPTSLAERLSQLVKTYDVRGASPELLDVDVARALGAAFAVETGAAPGSDGVAGAVVIGHDMRVTSPALADALADGVTSTGADVVAIGLASTDMLYFASGAWDLPGIMVTASHNPSGDNGLKMCRAGARPIGRDTGLAAIAERAVEDVDAVVARGSVLARDALNAYVLRVTELVAVPPGPRPLRVVVDAANGMGGLIAPAVLGHLGVELEGLYMELDGTFPNHPADPLNPANLVDLQRAVREHGADVGLAFDGDADRCFVIDEHGDPVSPSAVTAMIAARELAVHPGATVLHNVITSRAVREVILENGGTPVRTPVGHSLIKAEMARTDAVFGGEHSGHYYFRDFSLADSGMLAALHVMAAMNETGRPLSSLVAQYERYPASGEINSRVGDASAVTERVAGAYQEYDQDRLDGLTVTADTWWFNLRSSQTEPLLRLNVEADDQATMESVRDDVLALVHQESS
ncbi:phosphomannomutase/phosphoglucomutase [Mumia zhuanghuii]|uniref:Phosphomannomutase/phosphoglucomutase n=1 Tax=Mumia zhuanghuii TaxID=2585211 RepID=A0A5C4M9M9_9ACTN|nr:phosphomannomutase/phosphoglucomutase [Mumia zhuanghuii]TNC31230.1 phosphomannomutase/phosphoglucomutase [Mumia zhuanghuii]TNC44909.1 phosphomannomutase/phosphoglucomutase [Mumia zhuanghuii]